MEKKKLQNLMCGREKPAGNKIEDEW